MMQLFLEPVDVWLFRDGKPFDAKSDHRARSLFPPYPSVMQGVIRSHHLVMRGVDLRDPKAIEAAVGTAENYGDLKMRGPFVVRRDEKTGAITRYFPVPANAAPDKDIKGYRVLRPRPVPEGVLTSTKASDLPMLIWPEGEPTKEDFGAWLTEENLRSFLDDKDKNVAVQGVKSGDLFVHENRFGIGRNDATRTTDEGALYEVEFIRPCPGVGLWVQVEGYDEWPDKTGLLRIGGEGRGAHFMKVDVASPLKWPSIGDTLPSKFKVYFASPTYFTGGWKPTDGWGKFFDGTVTLQAVALRGHESLGGYDWAAKPEKAQKPARRYVPAGSVYYFSHDGGARLKQGTVTELGAEIGFGQIIVTEWREQ